VPPGTNAGAGGPTDNKASSESSSAVYVLIALILLCCLVAGCKIKSNERRDAKDCAAQKTKEFVRKTEVGVVVPVSLASIELDLRDDTVKNPDVEKGVVVAPVAPAVPDDDEDDVWATHETTPALPALPDLPDLPDLPAPSLLAAAETNQALPADTVVYYNDTESWCYFKELQGLFSAGGISPTTNIWADDESFGSDWQALEKHVTEWGLTASPAAVVGPEKKAAEAAPPLPDLPALQPQPRSEPQPQPQPESEPKLEQKPEQKPELKLAAAQPTAPAQPAAPALPARNTEHHHHDKEHAHHRKRLPTVHTQFHGMEANLSGAAPSVPSVPARQTRGPSVAGPQPALPPRRPTHDNFHAGPPVPKRG